MRTRKIDHKDAIISDILRELASSPEAKYYHRLDLVLLAINGMPIKDIAALYNESAKTISSWTKIAIERGAKELKSKEHPGRPPRLLSSQLKQLDADLQKSPEDFGYDINSWDGLVLSRHLEDHYGVCLQVRQCQRVIRQLGYTLQRPQTKPSGGDPEAQEVFKKN